MGIPHLTSDLSRQGDPVILRRLEPGDNRPSVQSVVVDGPGLVYYVYYRMLSLQPTAPDPLLLQPSPSEVSDGVVFLLLDLLNSGVEIEQIFFDGALPVSKRPTRCQRLDRESLKLHALYTASAKPRQVSKGILQLKGNAAPDLLGLSKPLPSRFSSLPTPAFMVPVVIEALQKLPVIQSVRSTEDSHNQHQPRELQKACILNQLGAATKVVPGEADQFCAAFSRRTGAAILSNDSDLLIYDLGEKGSVIKLESLESTYYHDGELMSTLISAKRWWLSAIAQNLHISGLNRLAFARSKNPHSSYASILRHAKQSLSNSQTEEFARFLTGFSMPISDSLEQVCLNKLDPRTSELFLQVKYPTSHEITSDLPCIYLPTLLENPARACSWIHGRSLRKLAYSVLNLSVETVYRHTQVLEHQRRGSRVAAISTPLLPLEDTISELKSWETYFSSPPMSVYASKEASLIFWIVVGLVEVSRGLTADGKLPISQDWTRHFLSPGRLESPFTWDDLHAYANAQAVLYSLRILKQILRAVHGSLPPELCDSSTNMSAILENLPDLCSLTCLPWELPRDLHSQGCTDIMIHEIYSLLEENDDE